MTANPPSNVALVSDDQGRLAAEVRLAGVRSQLAVVRALLDQIDHLTQAERADCLGEQLVEEVARLGSLLHEATKRAVVSPCPRDSGFFRREPTPGAERSRCGSRSA
jgi:hypothetical protein